MLKINSFLKETRKILTYKNITEKICIVLGNESCDLDSAMCAISLAYYYNYNKDRMPSKINYILPVINVARDKFPLKTETVYFLEKNAIEMEHLTFRDDVDDYFLKNNDLVLVDHHVSTCCDSIIAIYDHRPLDPSGKISNKTVTIIKEVGSCATLIGNLFLELENLDGYEDVLKLLYGPIILDTVNFSKEANKAKELDLTVAEGIENILGITNVTHYRKKLFDELVQARSDVSKLDSYQILHKDAKMISNKAETIKVGLPGYPILVQDYINLPNSSENIIKYANENDCAIILLIGMHIDGNKVRRDIGLINITNSKLFNTILENIIQNNIINLDLEEHTECKFLNGKFFNQKNVHASRKQILPIVKSVLENF